MRKLAILAGGVFAVMFVRRLWYELGGWNTWVPGGDEDAKPPIDVVP